jgi:hypothetical protein
MAQKKFTALPAAGALDGTEIVAVVQGGVSKKTTAQAVADLGTGGTLTLVDVDTSPGTFNFDFEDNVERIFNCTPAFGGGSKMINLSNHLNALSFKFIIEISGGTGLQFTAIGSGIRMDDVRWNLSPDIWIEPSDGKFLGEATYDGTDWFIKISGGPYVKT